MYYRKKAAFTAAVAASPGAPARWPLRKILLITLIVTIALTVTYYCYYSYYSYC